MMTREVAFGRLLAIANVLSKNVYEKGRPYVGDKYIIFMKKHPMKAIENIHAELMECAGKFGPDEIQLLDIFGEIMSGIEESDFNNIPLKNDYLLYYYKQSHVLESVIGVEEAAEMWGLSPGTVKNYCTDRKVKAKKIGKTWVIDKDQPNPRPPKL